MTDTLLPCPFCNKKLTKVKISGGIVEWAVHPSNDCVLSEFEFDYLPISAWNNRQPPWQPIATAPKDGSKILLFDVYGNIDIGSWGKAAPWEDAEGLWSDASTGCEIIPSRWMPIQPPPVK